MNVVIFCGGAGTRLHEETEFHPKPLVKVGGKPILWPIMKLYGHHGFREFVTLAGTGAETLTGGRLKRVSLWRTSMKASSTPWILIGNTNC
jgi:NDP-sugar pyrophosphorylase family protein